jgi:hypothetical protein
MQNNFEILKYFLIDVTTTLCLCSVSPQGFPQPNIHVDKHSGTCMYGYDLNCCLVPFYGILIWGLVFPGLQSNIFSLEFQTFVLSIPQET